MMYRYFDSPAVSLSSPRLMVRTIKRNDDDRLAEYYCENREFLMPWEPTRPKAFYSASGWAVMLEWMTTLQNQDDALFFLILEPKTEEVIGVINFSNILRGDFHACYLGYSLGKKWQGQGMMTEALQLAITFMFKKQNLHRIMASYMPHNARSAAVLTKLGFEKEGFAKAYLQINGQWRDHVLTALVNPHWKAVK